MSGEPENGSTKAAKILGAVVGLASIVGCVASLLSAGSETTSNPKMMKAPGQPGKVIDRGGFESNPSQYFRDLHKK